MHLEYRPAAVQAAFGGNTPRTPLAALRDYLDFRKIRLDLVAVAHVHGGANGDREGRRQIDGDVTGGCLQHRVAETSAGCDKLRGDAAAAGFRPRPLAKIHQLDAAAAALRPNRAVRQCEMNAAAAGIHLRRSIDLSQIDAAAARGRFYLALTALYLDAAATRLQKSSLQTVQDHNTAPARLGGDFTFGRSYANASATRLQVKIAAPGTDVNAAPAGAGGDDTANVIQVQTAAAAGRLHPAGDLIDGDTAAVGLDLHCF